MVGPDLLGLAIIVGFVSGVFGLGGMAIHFVDVWKARRAMRRLYGDTHQHRYIRRGS